MQIKASYHYYIYLNIGYGNQVLFQSLATIKISNRPKKECKFLYIQNLGQIKISSKP